ncbi:MAG: ATP-binding cassette domain-containing protein, partial [Flavobacteriaceae bacterium]
MAAPIVSLTHATIAQRDKVVLDGVEFAVSPGEFVFLIGKTGSGKSSLIKTLMGDLPLKAGVGQVAG